jgi:hypothetical protein
MYQLSWDAMCHARDTVSSRDVVFQQESHVSAGILCIRMPCFSRDVVYQKGYCGLEGLQPYSILLLTD